MRSDPGWERSRDCRLWGNDARTGAHGGMVESPTGRVSSDGEYGSLLDCSPRGIGRAKFQSAAGGYTPTGAGAGARQEDRPDRLRVDQRLHACGLLRGSFRPEEAVCMLRTLVRDKANLVAESGDWLRRMQKSLDQMNVRVHRAVSDIDGVTGMAILRAIVGGERDAQKLAKLRDRRCSKTQQEIAEQLNGHWRDDHIFSLQQALKMY